MPWPFNGKKTRDEALVSTGGSVQRVPLQRASDTHAQHLLLLHPSQFHPRRAVCRRRLRIALPLSTLLCAACDTLFCS
jgi:hypothetical protein